MSTPGTRAALPVAAGALCLMLAACGRTAEPAPPAECVDAWSAPDASQLVDTLVQATSGDRVIWTDYDIGDGAYALYTPAPDSSGVCIGLWKDGQAVSFTRLDEQPKLLTPLYGYYFRSDWYGGPDADMLRHSEQPAAVRTWLESTGVPTAIVMPVTVPEFPFKLPALKKAQLAIHEAFHVNVQAPRWYASTGNWPAWDQQPDRAGVQTCYAANDAVAAALEAEREQLVALIESLMDGDSTRACEACRAFLAKRMERYAMLSDVRVMRADSTPGTCAEAEAIMELEEGMADYGSWTVLYDVGVASRKDLIDRYRAMQSDMYYLTGNMEMHAVQLIQPDSMADIMREIAQSTGPDDGAPTAVLARALVSFCPAASDPPSGNGSTSGETDRLGAVQRPQPSRAGSASVNPDQGSGIRPGQ